jgi:hypothetical protein
MRPPRIAFEPRQQPLLPRRDGSRDDALGDLRFRALLSEQDWAALPPAIRRRFSRRLADGATIVYAGTVIETRMSRAGWWLAQAMRPIGAPLPVSRDGNVPSVVAVTEDMAGGGQVWTRLYARRAGFPQIIHSAKRFAGPTGLEEHVGFGVGMALTVHAVDAAQAHVPAKPCPAPDAEWTPVRRQEHAQMQAHVPAKWTPVRRQEHAQMKESRACSGSVGTEHVLVFRSAGYFVQLLGRRVSLPGWLTPGALTVTHGELPDGRFSFTLDLVHPRFGALIRQAAVFREAGT